MMMSNSKTTILLLLAGLTLTSCVTIKPGQVAMKQRFGHLVGEPRAQGLIFYNPFVTKIVRASAQRTNLMIDLQLPSKEGLSVKASISILYHIDQNQFKSLITDYGLDYEPIITAIFRSASSDVCAQFYAKDMHSGRRADIEEAILTKMHDNLKGAGIIIDAVLMKSITLPDGLAQSIEKRLQAEQDAMRMEFVLIQEAKEAERKIIEATGIRDAQLIQAEGLTDKIITMKSIEAFERLAASPNTKVIVTDGKTPFLIQEAK